MPKLLGRRASEPTVAATMPKSDRLLISAAERKALDEAFESIVGGPPDSPKGEHKGRGKWPIAFIAIVVLTLIAASIMGVVITRQGGTPHHATVSHTTGTTVTPLAPSHHVKFGLGHQIGDAPAKASTISRGHLAQSRKGAVAVLPGTGTNARASTGNEAAASPNSNTKPSSSTAKDPTPQSKSSSGSGSDTGKNVNVGSGGPTPGSAPTKPSQTGTSNPPSQSGPVTTTGPSGGGSTIGNPDDPQAATCPDGYSHIPGANYPGVPANCGPSGDDFNVG